MADDETAQRADLNDTLPLVGEDGKATAAARGPDGLVTPEGMRAIAKANLARSTNKGGRKKGERPRPVLERVREKIIREVERCLNDPKWFKKLSEHAQTQLLKLVVPSTAPVAPREWMTTPTRRRSRSFAQSSLTAAS